MAITTLAQLTAAMNGGQQIVFQKTGSGGAAGAVWYSEFNLLGTPPQGATAGTNTANGVVPDDTVVGCPSINTFGAGNTGYLAKVVAAPTALSNSNYGQRFRLCDLLFKAGAYAFNANTTLTSQPSYSSRIPNGDYKGTEIWFEVANQYTGNPTLVVTYTNQDGVAGQTATLVQSSAPTASRMLQVPLAPGDTGVQKIESVTATVATVGTFNILVLRPLWMGHAVALSDSDPIRHGPDKTGLPIVFDTSALYFQVWGDGGAPGNVEALLTIING